MTDKVNKSKVVKGDEFNKALEKCCSAKEIFELLGKTLDPNVIGDYASATKIPEVVNINACIAKRLRAEKKLDISEKECLDMAVLQYMKVTGKNIKKHIKDFDSECKIYARKFAHNKDKEQEKTAKMKMIKDYQSSRC